MAGSNGNVKMALAALGAAKWRSALTISGIVIGIVSVVTIVSLGEGARQAVSGQIKTTGSDLITVRPGRALKQTTSEGITKLSIITDPVYGVLSEADLDLVHTSKGVKQAVPLSYVSTTASREGITYDSGTVIGTTENLLDVLGMDLEFGVFFKPEEYDRNVAVIGKRVAEQLFKENVPIGKFFTIRGQQFIVRGVLEEVETSPLSPTQDYNTAIFIPYISGKKISGSQQSQIYQIVARPKNPKNTDKVVSAIQTNLTNAHSGQRDFSVLNQEDNLSVTNSTLNLLTGVIAAIAAISLIVAGIGILNIMLVSVTERTHEIGIRKAIGATNRQILGQFLTEATILSVFGGIFGVLLSILANYLLRIFTSLTPVLTWQIMVVAMIISTSIGIIFGISPALIAARKHPIDALRHD